VVEATPSTVFPTTSSVPVKIPLVPVKPEAERLVVEAFTEVSAETNPFSEKRLPETAVVEAFPSVVWPTTLSVPVVSTLPSVAPVAERLVVEAFEMNALVVVDRENAARVVVELVIVALNAEKLVVDAIDAANKVVVPFVTISLVNVALVAVSPVRNPFVAKKPEAERLVVEAFTV